MVAPAANTGGAQRAAPASCDRLVGQSHGVLQAFNTRTRSDATNLPFKQSVVDPFLKPAWPVSVLIGPRHMSIDRPPRLRLDPSPYKGTETLAPGAGWPSLPGFHACTKSIYRQGTPEGIQRNLHESESTAAARWRVGRCLAGAGGLRGELVVSDDLRPAPRRVRAAGSMPRPTLAAGTDQVPQIEHFVVVMMENHSFDNILGLIGRGDGFTLGPDGQPTAKNPDGHGNYVHAFHMPTECQTNGSRQRLEGHPRGVRRRHLSGIRDQHHGRGDGLLHQRRSPLHLRDGEHVPHRRSVLLLGHGPDGPAIAGT